VKKLKPTIFVAPPRIWNGFYTIYQNIIERLINKENKIKEDAEAIALTEISAFVGDRVIHVATGGSPTSDVIMNFIPKVFPKTNFAESYGATECGGITMNGKAMANVEVKLIPRPELGFTLQDKPYGRGEIAVKSNTLAMGYYNNIEATNESFIESWFLTGDLGQFEDGILKILDRKKSLVLLPNGELYCPSRLEAIYQQGCNLFSQVCMYNEKGTNLLILIATLNPSSLHTWNAKIDKKAKFIHFQEALEYSQKEVIKIAESNALRTFEIPVGIILVNDEWTPDNGFLTTSFKVVRHKIAKAYTNEIQNCVKNILLK